MPSAPTHTGIESSEGGGSEVGDDEYRSKYQPVCGLTPVTTGIASTGVYERRRTGFG